MGLTSTFIASQFAGMVSSSTSLGLLGTPPFRSYLWLLLALIPISALFSALSLALATMARSTKEGQYYLMPLMLLTMPLLVLPMLPSVELELGTAIIPVSGVLLLLRQLMEQDFRHALLYAAPVVAVTGACCWMAARWAVDQFNNESVLFRESERFSLQLWARHLVRDRMPTPSVAQAILCGIVIILVRFFVGLSTPMPQAWDSFAVNIASSLIALVLVPAVLMALVMTTRPTLSLLMRPTSFHSVAAAALLAVALHPLAVGLLAFVRIVYPIDPTTLAPFETILNEAPNLFVLLFVMAILPAVCEEFAFRGFILSGLRHMGHKWRAILVSAVLFGLAHGVLQQSIVAGMFGLVLGYIAVQTGSIWPCIVFHALHNTLGIFGGQWMQTMANSSGGLDWLVQNIGVGTEQMPVYGPLVVLTGLILAVVIVRWFHRLPIEKFSEERLCDALDNQSFEPVKV
jgi:sodium transport system permease protein